MASQTYKKRPGTSGIQGQLYETKLMSLVNFRAIHDEHIEEFSLASNEDDIGTFDDICFKAKVEGFDKPIAVFIQAKHRENDKVLTLNSKNDLAKYFDSYLVIRRSFDPSSKDMIFKGKFEETECFFVMYTTAKDDPNNNSYTGSLADFLNDLIGTGDFCSRPSYSDEDLDFLCQIVIKEQITALAEQMAKFICEKSNSEMSMNNDLMLRYHVILAHKVFDVSELQAKGQRIASFRTDFFETNEEFLVLLKNILCIEISKKRKSKNTDVQTLLLNFFSEPEVTTLSKLLGSVLTFKNEKLEFVSKSIKDDLKRQLAKIIVPQETVYEAAELAVKEHLLSLKLKVSFLFGNKDLGMRGDDEEEKKKRLNHLTAKIIGILEKSGPNNIVAVDDSMGNGFLKLNGGIASAVGNILVFDETTKLLKFTDNPESLGNLAKTLYEGLKSKFENLHAFRLDIKVTNFPKLSFERGEYDVSLVKDFYNKLLFFTNQADQYGVEEILKSEIEDHPCNDVNNFKVRSDVIFLKYHDEIQKLWMTPKLGSYLTKDNKIYENAMNNAMSEPLIGVLNMMHTIKNKDYIFNENAIKVLQMRGEIVGTVISTENCILTVAKVLQYLGNKDHAVLDLEHIFKLPLKNHTTLCKELTNTTNTKILIIVCNDFKNSRNNCKRLESIAKAVDGKQIIIVTNKISIDIMTKYFSQINHVFEDEKSALLDLSAESQKKVLAASKLNFQGKDLSLDIIVDDKSAKLIEEDVLNKIINNETIVIGKTVISYSYDKAKHFYIDRRVCRTKKQENDKVDIVKDKVLYTLYDLDDDVILITAIPGMGKSTLLTHLSLKTKELDPKVWIVRINLLEHTRTLSKWQEEKTVINRLESLNFMCQAAVSEETSEEDEELIELVELDDIVSLKKCSGDASTVFQLKMFLHYYNNGKLIFLFDGFDEIFPHYANEALSLVKSVQNYPRNHKLWITSRSFNHIKSILENEFGSSYTIEHFTRLEQDIYLNTYWKSKIQLNKLNDKQLKNVHDFVDFIKGVIPTGVFCIHSKIQHKPYFKVYMNFFGYLRKESIATGIDFSYDEYSTRMMKFDTKSVITYFANDFIAPPLHLYLLAEYFHSKIKDTDKKNTKWDIDISGYIFYEYYLETKLKKIRFQEKNKVDIYNPDNKIAFEKERVECLAKHKKLGAYAIFHPYVEIFDEAELKEIQDIIDELRDGREKTGLIRTVEGNIPLFVHMTFAEYFTVEYICDLLKENNNDNEEKQKKLWNFILNVIFLNCDMNIFDIFNTKMKMDPTLSSIAEKYKKIIFNLLYEQKNVGVTSRWSEYEKTDKINRGIDYTQTDRNILMFSTYSKQYDANHVNENSDVDFEQFFKFFYLLPNADKTGFNAVIV